MFLQVDVSGKASINTLDVNVHRKECAIIVLDK
jgi:hypothetical protein